MSADLVNFDLRAVMPKANFASIGRRKAGA
jgi:hypothetical protein